MRNKSIEQLENDYWTDEIEFPSGLVINCHKYRKIPIKDLTIEQLRLLISQNIGLEFLIEPALEKLDQNILAEGDLYEGDLLQAISTIPAEVWNENQKEFQQLERLVELNAEKLKNEIGEKQFDRIYERIKASAQQWL